jgi:creatinine amidohydrolase
VITRLARDPWPHVPAAALVLVPVGSTEQHGPHLPFDTDTRIATAVAEATAVLLEEAPVAPIVVAPALAFGASGEHQAFAGTVSIGHEALEFVLVELVRSLSTWAERIVFVNGHGGNVPTLARAVPRMRGEGHAVGWLPCAAGPGAGGAAIAGGTHPDAHAGRTETSLLLHLAPDLVELSRAAPGNTAPMTELLPVLAAEGVRAASPSGVLGDPSGASAAEGAALLGAMAASAARRIRLDEVDARGCLRGPGGGS